MNYLISEEQVLQLQRGCPPSAVQEVLGALPHVEKASVEFDSTRRDEVSIWGTLLLAIPRVLKARPGSWFEKTCSGIYQIGSQLASFLALFGIAYGFMWGYDYIQSQWRAGITPELVITLVALIAAAISAAACVIAIARIFRKVEGDGSHALSGLKITELQVQAILKSTPPGYVIKMLNNLPVLGYFVISETPPERTVAESSSFEPKLVTPEKPQQWWKLPFWMVLMLSLLWLAFGSLLSEDPETIASLAVIGLVIDAVFHRVWKHKIQRVIAERTGSTW